MSVVTFLLAHAQMREDDVSYGTVGKHGSLQCSVKTVDSGFKILIISIISDTKEEIHD